MTFSDAVKIGQDHPLRGKQPPDDVPFDRCIRAVARGEMTVDEAWTKYQAGDFASEPTLSPQV